MAQQEIPLTSRFLQGHHQVPGSAQLYSRDDIWPALRAQLLLWQAVCSGFRPINLRCFQVNDDHRTFLSWQQSDPALSAADKVFQLSEDNVVHPRPPLHFQDSDDEPSREVPASSSDAPLDEAPPSWREEPRAKVLVAGPAPEVDPVFDGNCKEIRFLLSASGVAHTAVKRSGSKMTCLACLSPLCANRFYPACGCVAAVQPVFSLPSSARLCRRRACILTGPETA